MGEQEEMKRIYITPKCGHLATGKSDTYLITRDDTCLLCKPQILTQFGADMVRNGWVGK